MLINVKWMNERCLGYNHALNSYIGHRTTWANEMNFVLNLLWIMPLVQDRSLNLLTSSPACYHCATDAQQHWRSVFSSKVLIQLNTIMRLFMKTKWFREGYVPCFIPHLILFFWIYNVICLFDVICLNQDYMTKGISAQPYTLLSYEQKLLIVSVHTGHKSSTGPYPYAISHRE